ncbi:hypothetical protein [Succinimonas sp.]|jgi:hypothetical protein|uniref:hypothetical protein n=1 Tax=Succinimonas sp. TaxID=1936151 RepID=UPI00386DA9FC
MKNFFIKFGRVCLVLFVIYQLLVAFYGTYVSIRFLNFSVALDVSLDSFFRATLVCYAAALLETILERIGRHDRNFDTQLGDLARIKKDLEKGLQTMEEIKSVQNFQSKNQTDSAPESGWSTGIKHS